MTAIGKSGGGTAQAFGTAAVYYSLMKIAIENTVDEDELAKHKYGIGLGLGKEIAC